MPATDGELPPLKASKRRIVSASDAQGAIVGRLDTVARKVAAASIGVDQTTLSKWISGDHGIPLERVGAFLIAHGLKPVPLTTICVNENTIATLEKLAEQGLRAGVVRMNAL